MEPLAMEKEVGKTTVSPEVLHKIARLTTLSVQGVSRMACFRGSLEQLLGKDEFKGIKVQIREEKAFLEIYVVLMSHFNVRDVSREIQSRVSRAITEMVGMEVGGVTVHIMDIDFNA
ncbi:MAG: Asp23/Gls24 family envelope stress response protein [Anaerolineaceae bacterium]|nr:Asp23/Gls24 family envelope stress response protein [Anaerolineaceae bacterium]